MLLEEAAKEREQGQLVRHNPCQNKLVALKKGGSEHRKRLATGKIPTTEQC